MIQEVRERPLLMRELLGESLRELRTSSSLTLREVSGRARVSLGYLSEIERGQKEASSELLASLCDALEVPLSQVLRHVADAVRASSSASWSLTSRSTRDSGTSSAPHRAASISEEASFWPRSISEM